jgi:cytoskeletal protein RodZ
MTIIATLPDLATLRQQKGISLGQIASSTKIRVHYLEGIERGQFTKLPGGIYNTSYIRQYARAIGFPETDLLDAYAKLASGDCRRD